ncbi:MAG: peptidoglycan DD-metalloendopeptidase family protein [Erythrobacter sp.]|nr:peptidoglycan DD-metalloendopeptidase family protein [Erythrobacter sp.]
MPASQAQRSAAILRPAEARAQLEAAIEASAEAKARARGFEQAAQEAEEAATRLQQEAAALAAQIQASEADIVAARARFSLAQVARARLSRRLAARRQPLVRLTAALQTTARRPLALSALQPGSLKELVYMRAVLGSAVPEIRARTQGLREDLARGRALERRASRALAAVSANERALRERREALAALEARQRISSREARANAAREAQRALALAESARDLDGLVDQLSAAAALREELAALPGPVRRPARLGQASGDPVAPASEPTPRPAARPAARPPVIQLPVQGRTLAGFGERRASGLRSRGVTLAPVPGAQIVVPAAGRIAFAGPYEGFGRIVIIEHPGGWTSVVTGMARTAVAIGQSVLRGEPLGVAGSANQPITIELRRGADPVNPLNYIG